MVAAGAALLAALATAAQVGGVVYQEQPTVVGCAAAAAAMVATRLGAPTGALALLRELPVHRDGVALADVERALAQRGLRATTMERADATELRRLIASGLPVIVVLRDGETHHTVVAVGYDRRALAILDPAAPGRRALPWRELARAWRGTLLVARPATGPGTAPRRW